MDQIFRIQLVEYHLFDYPDILHLSILCKFYSFEEVSETTSLFPGAPIVPKLFPLELLEYYIRLLLFTKAFIDKPQTCVVVGDITSQYSAFL